MANMTKYKDQVSILSEVYYRAPSFLDAGWEEFLRTSNIGLPLAYLIKERLVTVRPEAKRYVEHTFLTMLVLLDVEDTGFTTLDEVLAQSPNDRAPVSL